jgi:hypothetical protein
MSPKDRIRDKAAALDSSQEQLHASGIALLEEHLRMVAQRRVDDELEAVRASGTWSLDGSVVFEVTVRRAPPVSTS